jgi:hypothetical protein
MVPVRNHPFLIFFNPEPFINLMSIKSSLLTVSIFFFAAILTFSCTETELPPEFVPGAQMHALGDTLLVSGILIDTHCYSIDKNNIGLHHNLPQSGFREDCAEYCALQGYPVAVVIQQDSQDDEVWTLMTAPQLFADYMTQTVRVQGTFRANGVIDPINVELSDGNDNWIRIM